MAVCRGSDLTCQRREEEGEEEEPEAGKGEEADKEPSQMEAGAASLRRTAAMAEGAPQDRCVVGNTGN